MVEAVAMAVFADMGIEKPCLVLVNRSVGVAKLHLACPGGLDLGTGEGNAGLVAVQQEIIVAGINTKLFNSLEKEVKKYKKKIVVLGFVDNINELMSASDIIITKPGGITTAEAFAKSLPMIIINPLPGQEAMNTKFLLEEGVAVKAWSPEDVGILLDELLENRNKLKVMSDKARSLAKPGSSLNIAKLILGMK